MEIVSRKKIVKNESFLNHFTAFFTAFLPFKLSLATLELPASAKYWMLILLTFKKLNV
jgi:hypothetical protein